MHNTHARRSICKAVNVDWLKDIVGVENGAVIAAKRFEEHSAPYLMCMALQALSKIYSWEAAGKRSPNESRQQQLDRKLALRQQHCAPLMDCVDRIMETLAEKYAVKNDGKWQLARQGSAIGKAVIFWLNNSKELRTFLSDPRVSPDNNGVERAVRAATV